MEAVQTIASYIYQRYERQYGKQIDEMKLHKLLYFAQRESWVQRNAPLFADKFQAWRYGPVMVCIRQSYKDGSLSCPIDEKELLPYLPLFDRVFNTFADKDSWSLSSITHGEYAWQKARRGYAPDDVCTVEIETDDIRVDAERIRQRRFVLEHLKISSPQA